MIELFRKKSFKINLSWLLLDKLFRASLNIIITILIARTLGPEKFGILSYLLVLIFLFTTISTLGMNPVLTNKIIKIKNFDTKSIVVTCYLFRFFVSILTFITFVIFILFSDNQRIFFDYGFIVGFVIIFKSSEILFSYFEAKLQSKYIVISQFIGLIFLSILVLLVFIFQLDEIYIYTAYVVEAFSIFFLINIFFFKIIKNKFSILLNNFKIILKIIKDSFPVLIFSISIILYMRIDQIMINKILGQYDLGLYSVSVRVIEIFHFFPKIIMISYLPILLNSKKYIVKLIKINSYIFKLSCILIFVIIIFSEYFTHLLFGFDYLPSITTTNILSFSLVFVFFGVVNEHWYITNKFQKYYAAYVFFGSLLNILLNFYFIPLYGIVGAAYTTIATYIFIILLLDMVNKETQTILKIKLNSIFTI